MDAVNRTGFIDLRGWCWPAADVECFKAAFGEVIHLDRVYPHVRDFTACVQAGGNCGVFARALAERFGTVYTAEPDADNFACLSANCQQANIVKLQVALGEGTESPIDLRRHPNNCGAHQVGGAGAIPVLAIDALRLPACGLIHLDIEGYEAKALAGARETIARYQPVIVVENKGISNRYGVTPEALHDLIVGFGYRQVEKYCNDVVYAPC